MGWKKPNLLTKMILSRLKLLLVYLFLLCLCGETNAVIYSGPKGSNSGLNYHYSELDHAIQKVSFTQRGYIQFLKYTTKVPTMTDYTFCIWLRSSNLTYNHPILSYSRHEKERVIRVWVSERGKYLSLEIMEHQIFKVPVDLVEHVWYHVCQSWSTQQAAWDLFFNGKLKSSGFVPKLKGVPIKGGGDIVVGQEYTDFDKGLDDGIEGDVFGFNLVLSSTPNPSKLAGNPQRRRFDARPLNIHQSPGIPTRVGTPSYADNDLNAREVFPLQAGGLQASGRSGRTIFQDMMSLFNAEVRASHIPVPGRFYTKLPALPGRRISNEIAYDSPKTLGLQLVELSFDCALKKGAPLSGNGVLISWTKSSVRVFGGAILKKVQPFCRKVDS